MKRKRSINISILTYANGLGDNRSLSYKTGNGHAQMSVPTAKNLKISRSPSLYEKTMHCKQPAFATPSVITLFVWRSLERP